MIRQEIDVAKGCALHSQPAAALVRAAKRPALIVESNELAAQRMTEDLNLLLDGGARNLPARDISFLKTAASSRELSIRRGARGSSLRRKAPTRRPPCIGLRRWCINCIRIDERRRGPLLQESHF